jgi:predicted nucleotidyltransferase
MNHRADIPILHDLLEQVQAVLGEQFVGLYLHGSLALGDFDLTTSDIDFAVVTQNHLEAETISKLEVMHKNLLESSSKTAAMLEGAYIPSDEFRRHDELAPAMPQVHGDAFYIAQLEPHWVLNRAILREHGVTLAGPNPSGLIDPISLDARQKAVRDFLCEWWQPMLTDSTRLENAEYRVYAVQTMARALCTLETGKLLSKPGAIHWALEHSPVEWHDTFRNVQIGQVPTLNQTILFLNYSISVANHSRLEEHT